MALGDLELLGIQAERSFDDRGRIAGLYGVVIARAPTQQALWIGADVPELVAAELGSVFAGAPGSRAPAEPPPALERCRRLLETDGRVLQERSGPCYLIEPGTAFASSVRIERSDQPLGAALRGANPGNWEAIEWDELIDGQLGSWAISFEGALVASICHTPGPVTARGAECGVWTHPAFRGRGHAAAVTAVWAEIMRPTGRRLFYSTDADNFSSQRVAQRLRLRPLGWTWRLGAVRAGERDHVHPLSSLRRRS
jgi:RimJ/RimL family protein N-acetyltransferase